MESLNDDPTILNDRVKFLPQKMPGFHNAVGLPLSSGGGGGSGRGDTTLAASASSGNSIDMVTSQTVIITMDANLTAVTPAVNPTIDGQRLTLIFKKGNPAFTAVLDPAKFRGNLDVVIPSPLLNPTINTRDIFTFIWNATDSFYTLVGFARRDP